MLIFATTAMDLTSAVVTMVLLLTQMDIPVMVNNLEHTVIVLTQTPPDL